MEFKMLPHIVISFFGETIKLIVRTFGSIDWNAVGAIATAVGAIATAWMAFLTYSMFKDSKLQAEAHADREIIDIICTPLLRDIENIQNLLDELSLPKREGLTDDFWPWLRIKAQRPYLIYSLPSDLLRQIEIFDGYLRSTFYDYSQNIGELENKISGQLCPLWQHKYPGNPAPSNSDGRNSNWRLFSSENYDGAMEQINFYSLIFRKESLETRINSIKQKGFQIKKQDCQLYGYPVDDVSKREFEDIRIKLNNQIDESENLSKMVKNMRGLLKDSESLKEDLRKYLQFLSKRVS
ncbi:MAG: hypothetical protein KGJ09_04350 [Candidatus Omnitrophica bacterium]|nr:hypothetical protein [Candidatus Omnitrophota bacterium]MDE2009293.1 hypothetical protein [Candidatus Omnitrophota bacterium]MDE2213812.1 hypothetical protein [Candidatus Omnitrophota bacterium]